MTEWILTSSVLILLVIAVRGFFKNKMKAKYIYALWLIVLVRLLCPVNFGELSFNLLSLAEEGKTQVQEHLELQQAEKKQELQQDTVASEGIFTLPDNSGIYYPPIAEDQEQMHAEAPVVAPETKTEVKGTVPAEEPSGFSFPEINWQKALSLVWIAGMALMASIIFVVNISFGTMLNMFRKELPAFTRKGLGNTDLSVYLADGINSSCLYGVLRPSIYLNKKGMGEREKTYCVEHEYSHYLQGDMAWSLCRVVCLVLHWYNPLVWLAVILSKKDAELACDERTIERLGEEERFTYGHTLVELAARQSKAVQMFGVATLIASDKKEVVERVKAITTKKQTKIITGILVAFLVIGIGFFVFTGEAKGEQENNKKNAPVATETPVPTVDAQTIVTPAPTMDPALEEFIEKSKEERSRNELLTYILETNEFPVEGSVVAAKLNVRSAAGYDTDLIDILSEGTTVVINAVEQDADGKYWYAVSYDQKDSNWYGAEKDGKEIKNGYVYSAYLTEVEAAKVVIAPTEAVIETVVLPQSSMATAEPPIGMMGEDYVYARVPGQNLYVREEGITVKDEVKYQELSFTDALQVKPEKGKGWKIDLNGDGTKELFYLDELRGIYINERLVQWMDFRDTCELWFLDIDTTDGIYEFLLNSNVYYYDGSEIQPCAKFARQSWRSGNSFTSEIQLFDRVDEHTISFRVYNSAHHCSLKSEFALNEKHQLVEVENNNCFDFSHKHITQEMFVSWKGESTTVVQDLRNTINVTYENLSFTDHIKLTTDEENGWCIDLNGDGVKEELYIFKKEYYSYLCINGYGIVLLDSTDPDVWLLDIDTTDSIYEILTDEGSVMVYDGKNLKQTWALRYYTFADGCTFHGTLSDFTRVDEHTIACVDICSESPFCYEMKEVWYRLDSDHGLQKIVRTDGKEQVLAEIGRDYTYPGEPFRLYESKDENSNYVEAATDPFSAFTSITDEGSDWFYVVTKDYGSGWIKYGTHTKLDQFLRQITDATAVD